jgi:D-alanine-D-alanine ligase
MTTVLLYDIDPAWAPEDQDASERESRRLGHALRRQGHSVAFAPVTDDRLPDVMTAYDPNRSLVLNWCESLPGVPHSEPLVAEILDDLMFPYTGASAETLRLSYDKARVKHLLGEFDVPTPRWAVYADPAKALWAKGFPAIVKPACEHCSLGVGPESVVMTEDELRRRVAHVVREFEQPALVEAFIDGREFHVPLWGNNPVEMLAPVEMDFSALGDVHERLCSYDAKFVPESKAYRSIKTVVPARLDAAEYAELERVSRAAYGAVGCRDYGRIDVRMKDGVFYVVDVNPNADISADASVAVAAGKMGYCYGAMGRRVLEFAVERLGQNRAPHQ